MRIIKKEVFLSASVLLLALVAIAYPREIVHYPSFIDWKTITALTGLLIITTGLKESGYFYFFSLKTLKKIESERGLAVFLIFLSASLSTFLTNDITLFIVVPLTICMQNLIKNNISKLVIFEAVSVNLGSALTPVGNPQNLFLWHKWGISSVTFIVEMLPLVAVLFILLLIFAYFLFPGKKINFSGEPLTVNIPHKRSLFYFSLAMLAIYFILLEMNQTHLFLPLLFILYLVLYKNVLLKTDWLLLLTFIIIFIDFHVVSTIPAVTGFVNSLNLHSSGNVFLLSVITSQIISNVPASVFVSKFNHDWFAIAYGVNVAGNGLIIGSLANIIALRMVKSRKIWLDFHKYSIPYFVVTLAIVYVLFFSLYP